MPPAKLAELSKRAADATAKSVSTTVIVRIKTVVAGSPNMFVAAPPVCRYGRYLNEAQARKVKEKNATVMASTAVAASASAAPVKSTPSVSWKFRRGFQVLAENLWGWGSEIID